MKRSISLQNVLCIVVLIVLLASGMAYADTKDTYMEDIKVPEYTSQEDIREGIIEIKTGAFKESGDFKSIKNSCGVIIHNSADGAYILTTEHNTRITKSTLEKEGLRTDSQIVIMAVVKGDVMTELSIVAKSKDYDFCILKADNVINERSEVTISSVKANVGDTVKSYGFSQKDIKKNSFQFLPEDVKVNTGTVIDPNCKIGGHIYIRHTAEVNSANNGGVLASEEGYILGLNNSKVEGEEYMYYALPIEEIEKVLKNYAISYNEMSTEELYGRVYHTYEVCVDAYISKGYTSKSKQELYSALEAAKYVLINSPNNSEDLLQIERKLISSYNSLVEKKPILFYVDIALVGLIAFLLTRLILLIVWKRKLVKSGLAPVREEKPKRFWKKERPDKEEVIIEPLIVEPVAEPAVKPVYETISPFDPYNSDHTFDSEKTEFFIVDQGLMNRKEARLREVQTNKLYSIDRPMVVIGKKEGIADIVINIGTISRKHACIELVNDEYWIYDLNSTNGTFVNGRPIDENGIRLNDKDKLRLSNIEFVFEIVSR